MKILCLSDLHGFLPDPNILPSVDLVLISGDIIPALRDHEKNPKKAADWLNTSFRYWLEKLPADNTIFCAGNHDYIFMHAPQLVPTDLKATYLQDSKTEYRGLKIWGTPWQLPFGSYAFQAEEECLSRKYSEIPRDIDILLSHGPKSGTGDVVLVRGMDYALSTGSVALNEAITKMHKLRLMCFGHIHSDFGVYPRGNRTASSQEFGKILSNTQSQKNTLFINASLLDESYLPRENVFVVDMQDGFTSWQLLPLNYAKTKR